MRRLLVVAHPWATHQAAGLVGGWYDSALTPCGLEQAGRIAQPVREINSADVQLICSGASILGRKLRTCRKRNYMSRHIYA